MSDEKDDSEPSHIDQARIKRMRSRGHLMSMLEEFEILRLKFIYGKLEDKQETTRFVTLIKYFMENGPSEAMRLNCKLMYEKYIEKFGL